MDYINNMPYQNYQQQFQNQYPQMNAQYNRYQPQQTPSQPANTYYYVNGLEGAKAFQITANKTVILMDTEAPIFYLKSSNDLGQATIRAYRFEEVNEVQKPQPNYVTREEVEEIIKNTLNLGSKTKKSEVQ